MINGLTSNDFFHRPIYSLVLVFLSLLLSPQSFGNCSCIWQGSFVKAHQQADLIVSGTVISSKGNSLDFDIQTTLFDRATPRKEFNPVIRVWGDNGQECRPDISEFPPHSKWVFSLKKITGIPEGGFNPNTPNISYGRVNDYYLSKCGANWLQLHDGYVTGNLVKGRRWEWTNDEMNPVLLELVQAYVNNVIPQQALIEAAKPQTEAKKLMEQTKRFIEQQ